MLVHGFFLCLMIWFEFDMSNLKIGSWAISVIYNSKTLKIYRWETQNFIKLEFLFCLDFLLNVLIVSRLNCGLHSMSPVL